MNSKENLFQQITERFDKAIYGLRDSGIEGIEDVAGRVVPRIVRGEIGVEAAQRIRMPVTTSFYLEEILYPGPTAYKPAIIIDSSRIMSDSPEAVQGDLARTVSVADQFPDAGFQNRFSEIYASALERQRYWLEQQDAAEIELDPRVLSRDEILQKLLGEPYFYTDCGWKDWQKAADRISRQGGHTEEQKEIIKQLRGSIEHFLSVRQKFIPMAHNIAIQTDGKSYLEMSADERAEAAAIVLFGSSLYARGPEN